MEIRFVLTLDRLNKYNGILMDEVTQSQLIHCILCYMHTNFLCGIYW